MEIDRDRFMKVSDIPETSNKIGFLFAFGTFLDHFYHHEEIRPFLINEEPKKANLPDDDYCLLAATVHKLAKDYFLPIPQWVMDNKFVMAYPVYGFNTKNKEFQDALRATTPIEFSTRNLFLGSNVLSRA